MADTVIQTFEKFTILNKEKNMETETKKINLKSIIIIALAAVIGSIAGGYIYNGITGKNNFDKILVEAANEVNKTLPIMVDSETRLDSTMALPNKEYSYFYTLINYSVDEIDAVQFEKEMRPGIINQVKTNSDLEVFRNNNVTLNYVYRDKNLSEIVKIKVTPKDYK
jgi:hypothetical protein